MGKRAGFRASDQLWVPREQDLNRVWSRLQPELCCKMQGFISHYFCLAGAFQSEQGQEAQERNRGPLRPEASGLSSSPSSGCAQLHSLPVRTGWWPCVLRLKGPMGLAGFFLSLRGVDRTGYRICRTQSKMQMQRPLELLFKSCKVVTAEHETKPRSLLGAGHAFMTLAPGCRRAAYFSSEPSVLLYVLSWLRTLWS